MVCGRQFPACEGTHDAIRRSAAGLEGLAGSWSLLRTNNSQYASRTAREDRGVKIGDL